MGAIGVIGAVAAASFVAKCIHSGNPLAVALGVAILAFFVIADACLVYAAIRCKPATEE